MMNWRDLNKKLPSLSENEVEELLLDEMLGLRRSTVVVRLHQRFTALRGARERDELFDILQASLSAERPTP